MARLTGLFSCFLCNPLWPVAATESVGHRSKWIHGLIKGGPPSSSGGEVALEILRAVFDGAVR